MPNRKGHPVALKTIKEREDLSSKFMCKNNSPLMIVLCCPKLNKYVLLESTAHSEPDLWEALHKKHVATDFYNS